MGLSPGNKITGGKILTGKTNLQPIVRQLFFVWRLMDYPTLRVRWVHFIGGNEHVLDLPKKLPLPRINWRVFSIVCSRME